MGVADFSSRCSRAFPRRFFGTRDQPAIGREILHAWEACDVMHFVKQYEAEDLADTRNRLQQIQGLGVMVLGRFADGQFDVTQQLIVVGNEGKVDFDAFLGAVYVSREGYC